MPDDDLSTEEIFLRQNAPEELEKMVAAQVERFKREGRTEELTKFLEERTKLDKAWELRRDTYPKVKMWNEQKGGEVGTATAMTQTAKRRMAEAVVFDEAKLASGIDENQRARNRDLKQNS